MLGYLKHLSPSLVTHCDASNIRCESCVFAKSHAKFATNGKKCVVTFVDDCIPIN